MVFGVCHSSIDDRQPAIHNRRRSDRGFTLLEVTIALGIFFAAAFAILCTVSSALKGARALREIPVDASMLAAQLSITNKLYEASDSGDFHELGNVYRDYSWSRDINEVGTNGLFEADFTIHHHTGRVNSETKMSVLFFRPESPAGGGGVPIGRP
ncbi:MAG: hypothetical protein C5B50_29715 [Verrucomicrobia bacterium]|nr:MAG: hypothetical protein C5B50_29715 [Verrucomicrobiota bacterium]